MSLRHFHEVLPTRLARPEISLIPFRVVQTKVGDRLISGKFADRGSVDPPLPFVLLHGLLIAFLFRTTAKQTQPKREFLASF